MVYRETTNPPVATGDGMAAAYRAGAELRDMEFMQFHPTVLYVAGSAGSSSARRSAAKGRTCATRTASASCRRPTRGPSWPRATSSPRPSSARMERTQHPNVYLDLSHLDPAMVRHRFPGIDRVCRSFGLDITRDRIPVRPGAHYMIGGVTVDAQGRTTLPGLWAAGEVTSSGLHGANRLASNSLLEGLVFGALCGRGAAEAAAQRCRDDLTALPLESSDPAAGADRPARRGRHHQLAAQPDGAARWASSATRRGCWKRSSDVAFWCRYVLAREFDARAGWELQNLLTVARLMIDAALRREESRGVHFRSDFPTRDDAALGLAAHHRTEAGNGVNSNPHRFASSVL